MRSYIASSVGSLPPPALSPPPPPPPSLLRADREQPLELAFIAAQRLEALLDGREERDDRLTDCLLELSVPGAVEALLERFDRLTRGDVHDLEQVGDAGFLLRGIPHLPPRV